MMPHTGSISLRQAIHETSQSLCDFDEGRLEAEILLGHVLNLSRTELSLRLDEILSPVQSDQLELLIRRRLKHEPIAYIIGHKEFFGIDFHVTPDTLIPRPETELLVEKTLDLSCQKGAITIADIGTGCGTIAIALAVQLTDVKILATDISAKALEIANLNTETHGVTNRIQFLQGDLLQPVLGCVDIIVTNLPYITDSEMEGLAEDVRLYEPVEALAAGADGLNYIRGLLSQSREKLNTGGAILLEIGYQQGLSVQELARQHFPNASIEIIPDLGGNDRVVIIRL